MKDKGLLLYAPPDLRVPVRYVKGVGPKGAQALAESRLQILTIQDLLTHYPRRHLDFSETKSIREVGVGDEVTIFGEVRKVQAGLPKRPKMPTRVQVYDGTMVMTLVFFNQPWRAKQLRPGTVIAAKGKVTAFKGARQMNSPLVDVVKDPDDAIKIVPIYPATAEIHTAWLRKIIKAALDDFSPLVDPLPDEVRKRHGLLDRSTALRNYHFPAEMNDVWKARRRLVFDELFTLQTGLAYRKHRVEKDAVGIAHKVEGELAGQFVESLPFKLTKAQMRSIEEIESDMAEDSPMHRLLQGEVGSGKTVVALYAALLAVQGGWQAAIMAPTEVLAMQHFLTISRLLEAVAAPSIDQGPVDRPLGVGQLGLFAGCDVVLLTGSVGAELRKAALAKAADGRAGIVVGTHALIQEGVDFANLGLAVVDEQHRFGVHQRVALKNKAWGFPPDVLIMTATPIPRTLALTLYGDLDVSVLDELPAGRRPIETQILDDADRSKAYDLVRREVASGHQAYVITPLVDDSDKLEVKSAEAEAERLSKEVFPDLRVGKIHGRLRAIDKESMMAAFRAGQIDVLISTTVIEVGVDVPNATVMLIEDADRFGLSQLHQLRGRIGRGEHDSTCILLTNVMELPEDARADAKERLDAVASSTDGFVLAEKDLEIRGSGTIMGARQAGWSDLKITNLVKDVEILARAREEAFGLIEKDPELKHHELIRQEMEGRFADRLEWLFRS